MNLSTMPFPAASKLLQKRWEERQHRLHVRKMNGMKSGVNNVSPKTYPHLFLRLKKIQKDEEKQSEIDHNNKLLLSKMTYIMRSRGQIDNWNDYETRSLNRNFRAKQLEKIAEENMGIAKRLEKVKPMYHVNDWEDDFEKYSYLQDMWDKATKDYYTPRDRHLQKLDDYDEDFEEDTDLDSSNVSSNVSKLPRINRRKHTVRRNEYYTPTKLPKIKQSPREAAAEQDAKLLFRGVKGMGKLDEAVLKTLIRKTHSERLAVSDKFDDLYDLNLKAELKSSMGSAFDVLIECLLADRMGAEILDIKKAIQDNDTATLIRLISTKSGSEVAALNKAYRKKYDKYLYDDVQTGVVDEECQMLLQALVKDDRADSDRINESLAMKDAEELYESGDARFTSDRGKFMRIIQERSFPQIRTTLADYRMISGGDGVTVSMQEDGCSQEFIQAVDTLANCLSADPVFWAEKLRENMAANNAELITMLLVRSQIDLPQIKRAYKKKYNTELTEDILSKCGREAGPLIAQIARSTNISPSKEQTANRRVNGIVVGVIAKKTPLKRPVANKTADASKNSPLSHPAGQSPSNKNTDKKKTQHSPRGPVQKKVQKGNGTVKPAKNFDAKQDAADIHEALAGWGTDEAPLIHILAGRDNNQRQQIQHSYQQLYDKKLSEALERELSGDFEELILALMRTPPMYDAYCLHDALDGMGTTDTALIGILATRNAKELEAISLEYEMKYGDLSGDIADGNNVAFQEVLLAILDGNRDKSTTVNRDLARQDAQLIHKGANLSPEKNHETIKNIFTKRNSAQIKATFEEYHKLSGFPVEDGLKKAKLGDAELAFLDLAQVMKDPVEFYAQRLKESMSGMGTNDKMLIRILVSRSEIDLVEVKAKYKDLYRKNLEDMLETECSGQYKKMLLAIVKNG